MSRAFTVIKNMNANMNYRNQSSISIARKHPLLAAFGFVVPAVALAFLIYFICYTGVVSHDLASSLIRLHVVANSDSAEDQALKLRVRDSIVNYMDVKLRDSQDIERTRQIIGENLGDIKSRVESEIRETGSDYAVDVSLGVYPFPEKTYGEVTLPSGYYQALKVVIGSGTGKNWWCVIFPPLCFVDATHSKLSDGMKNELKKSLTSEEYKLIMSADDSSDIPIRVKFKVVEILQDAKIQFNAFLARLLGGSSNSGGSNGVSNDVSGGVSINGVSGGSSSGLKTNNTGSKSYTGAKQYLNPYLMYPY